MIFGDKTRKKRAKTPVFSLFADVHSHLIPGIDDGCETLDESIEIIGELARVGYKKLIVTPHIICDIYPNSSETIVAAAEALKRDIEARKIAIRIETAAEYYLDEGFASLLDAGDILTFGENYLLFETSYYHRPLYFEEMIFAMKGKGYRPVLAHPERYRYLKNTAAYRELKRLGVSFQCNIGSFDDGYGPHATSKAMTLAQNGMIDFLGSDVHDTAQTKHVVQLLEDPDLIALWRQNPLRNAELLEN